MNGMNSLRFDSNGGTRHRSWTVGVWCVLFSVVGVRAEEPPAPARAPTDTAPATNIGVSLANGAGSGETATLPGDKPDAHGELSSGPGLDTDSRANDATAGTGAPPFEGGGLTSLVPVSRPERDGAPARALTRRPHGTVTDSSGRLQAVPWYRKGLMPLAVVMGGVAGWFFLVRRFVPAARLTEGGLLKVVARATLSPKHQVSLIQVGAGRFVLVGLAGDGVTRLCEIDDGEEVAALMSRCSGTAYRDGDAFRTVLDLQDSEFERACEDVGDTALERPGGVSAVKSRLGGLMSSLRTLRDKATS